MTAKKSSLTDDLFSLLFCFVLIVPGVWMVVSYTIPEFSRLIQLSSWEETKCHVVHSEIRWGSRANSTMPEATPDIRYTYSVSGKTFTGKRVSLFGTSGSGSKKVVAKFPVGKTTPCSYDPKKPADAVLESSVDMAGLFLSLLPFAFLYLGIKLFLGILREMRAESSSAPL